MRTIIAISLMIHVIQIAFNPQVQGSVGMFFLATCFLISELWRMGTYILAIYKWLYSKTSDQT